ncbi:hypothetical protein B0H14DRAFT_2568568 [Mycena olivaceomarginata]|nr:hypothetical protein B0H14DRAFT_2568568 [Mycena olivaceomarginata]
MLNGFPEFSGASVLNCCGATGSSVPTQFTLCSNTSVVSLLLKTRLTLLHNVCTVGVEMHAKIMAIKYPCYMQSFGPLLVVVQIQQIPQTSIYPWNEQSHLPAQSIDLERHGKTARDAFHNSAERYPQPRCHPETRKRILDDLKDWSFDTNSRTIVLWLHGPAGAGKSAIAQSFCQNLEAGERLVAGFFFNGERCKVVFHHRVSARSSEKFEKSPFARAIPQHPIVIVIDGLDECGGQNIQQEILRSIGNSIRDEHLPLRFLIASRPEPHIRDIFVGPCLKRSHRPLNINRSFDDVHNYLVDEFTRIHADHHETMAGVPYDKYFRPTERLEIIMGIADPDSESPFSALDQLYTQILVNVPQIIWPRLLRILTVIVTGLNLIIPHIEQLLELKPGDVQLTLCGLHSVVKIDERLQHVTLHHASFLDFLDNPTRSGMFYVGSSQQRMDLAWKILRAFSYKCDDPFLNRSGPVALCLQKVLEWLKEIRPCPQDLIDLLEDYKFISQCDRIWSCPRPSCKDKESHKYSEILSQASQQLIRVLHVYRLDFTGRSLDLREEIPNCKFLLNIHFLLNLSWDEIRRAICPLRSIIGEDVGSLNELLTFVWNPPLPRIHQCGSIFWDIAFGYLPMVQAVRSGRLPAQFRQVPFNSTDIGLIQCLGGLVGTGHGAAW